MAEISALTPSPPALGNTSAPPKQTPLPKSTLYGDLREALPATQAPGVTTTAPAANHAALPPSQRGPSPDRNPSPNLYPNVSVNAATAVPPAMNLPRPRTPPHSTEPPGTPGPPGPPIPELHEPAPPRQPAPDTLSYLESASLMSGTLESLSGLGDDGSSLGSDSELNGAVLRRTDKYGFLGGAQYSESSEESRVDVARQREMKWLEMFGSWDKWVSRRFQKVKLRCRKGIPSSLRARAWQLLSDSAELLESNPGKFEELEREQGDPKWLDIIEKDLHRQFPFHEMFAARGGHGQQDLFRILKAYTVYRPDEGYCQAQAPVAAVLLMHMPAEAQAPVAAVLLMRMPAEQAFWCLVQICEKYLPGYYSAGLEAIQLDGEIFFGLLRRVCPMAYRHLKKFKVDPILYMTEWFMCIFSRSLPWACVLRVWDMFFCEGVKVVFRVGLVLLKLTLGSVEKLKELQGMYETMERLRNIPPESVREDVLITEVSSLAVSEALIERESSIQVRRWRESRGPLSHQPGRRLYGTRSIHEQKRRSAAIRSGGSFSFLGGPAPAPGPLRASSSLLSLPVFRRSKAPFQAPAKKASFSGVSGLQPALSSTQNLVHKPPPGPPPPSARPQEPLVGATTARDSLPPNTLSPTPKIVSEQITPTIPSPTANNAPMPPSLPLGRGPPAAMATATGAEEVKKKKKSKEDKKREKEEEKCRARERREKDRAEKDRQKKEKDKKKEKGGKRKEKEKEQGGGGGGGDPEEKNGATAPGDLA